VSTSLSESRPGRLVAVSLNAAIDKTAAVDHLVPGTIHRPRLLSTVPGGKAVNVARAARHLGMPASVVAVLGGHAGRWYREALTTAGIEVRVVEVTDETRTCLSVLDESTGRLTEFYEAGVRLSPDDWTRVGAALADALTAHGPDVLVVLAGSLPPGAPTDAYGRLGRLMSAAGVRWVVDVDGPALSSALADRPWLVKVNADEAERATGVVAGTAHAAGVAGDALRALGAEHAIVTRGIEGAVLASPEGAWQVGPAPERGPFSVGSGDAFLAGLAAALAAGQPLSDALGLAAACGTANALVPGQGELQPADVARLVAACSISRLG
jgi:1-phosphofructokinase family hexose kinase